MSADECKVIPQIVQGERKELTLTLLNSKTGEAIDISTATEIQSVHPQESGDFLIKKLEKAGVAEITTIETVADVSQSLASKYFRINAPEKSFAFYFTVGGNGEQPSISGIQLVEVAINEDDDANSVAAKLQTFIDAQAEFSASVSTNTVTVTNASNGSVDNAQDVDSGFTIATSTEGVTEVVDSIEVIGTGQVKIKLSTEETKSLKVENRTTMHLSVDFPSPTGRKIYKITEAYDVCETDFNLD